MTACINTVAFHGIEGQGLDVQVKISNGFSNCTIVGSSYSHQALSILIFLAVISFLILLPGQAVAQVRINDVSGLNETIVSEIRTPVTEEDVQEAIREALSSNKKISIAGRRHSQGGHIMTDQAIVLDMTGFNKIINLDVPASLLRVQSGVTWAQIQDYLNPRGLAVKVQQSSNIFTVGGSLGANIHGRDPRFGTIIDTIRSFRIVTPRGEILTVSREENADLFSLAIGGYGLFGVITEVELEVVQNSVLRRINSVMSCKDYISFLDKNIRNDPKIEVHYARPDITKRNFMKSCLVTSYIRMADKPEQLQPLMQEKLVEGSKWLLNLSRKTDWGKDARWFIQEALLDETGAPEIISRNNAMRPPIEFLDYKSEADTDVLQEYFIPIGNSESFISDLGKIVSNENINILSITLRFIKKDDQSSLPYAVEDGVAFVLYINHGKDESAIAHAKLWTQKIIDAALRNNGTYYLTYANYASREQFAAAYPLGVNFFEKKRFYDPSLVFMNKFYEMYGD
ncbi:MAG: FAD-binding oxidoreductase [Alphaproteobacteria bacterium]|nr:FAD-binding oxidoreductase [Alphaproteobacteria bacterium]